MPRPTVASMLLAYHGPGATLTPGHDLGVLPTSQIARLTSASASSIRFRLPRLMDSDAAWRDLARPSPRAAGRFPHNANRMAIDSRLVATPRLERRFTPSRPHAPVVTKSQLELTNPVYTLPPRGSTSGNPAFLPSIHAAQPHTLSCPF
ncbi:hypothetical protein C8Q78DRAFT_1082536 [Trametes maxima]|nr:hypothetical protein C8Q78DRAFT_1082536 [Trametes maxima]